MVRLCGPFLWPSLTVHSGLVARVLPSAIALCVPVRVVDLGGSVLWRWRRGLGRILRWCVRGLVVDLGADLLWHRRFGAGRHARGRRTVARGGIVAISVICVAFFP
jgi:hypothetical protein